MYMNMKALQALRRPLPAPDGAAAFMRQIYCHLV